MAKSSFERVVGNVPEEEKKEILEKMRERFDDQIFNELAGKEREKTPEESEIIALANEATNALRREYGLADFDVPQDNIHIIKTNEWPEYAEDHTAFYSSQMQAIAMQEQFSRSILLTHVIHELVHFKSYNAMQVTLTQDPKLRELRPYRGGLEIHKRDSDSVYFNNLNEAITEDITKELAINILQEHPLFKEELEQTKELAARYSDISDENGNEFFTDDLYRATLLDKTTWKDAIARVFNKERSRKVEGKEFTYQKQREILSTLALKIFEHNKEQFNDTDEVMRMFAKSMLTGNILSLGKLIDTTFGKGTFRKIGELDADIEKQRKFVDSL
ncbi:MAG: hypothetical protein Q7S28_00195 [bacterium]|nr:hypothetical protein [bacterium]